jgi:hypothetical protein
MLAGQTLDGMRVYDIVRGIEILKEKGWEVEKLSISGNHGESATLAKLMLGLNKVEVILPAETEGIYRPDYLNLLRFTNWDELGALARPFDY